MKRLLLTATATACFAALSAGAGMAGPADRGDRATFEQFDADGDGRVTREEMQGMAARRLVKADADGDGAVSRAELLAHATEQAVVRVDRVLARLDANRDGLIGADEMSGETRAARRFDRLDTDKDGAISRAEFDAARARQEKHRGQTD